MANEPNADAKASNPQEKQPSLTQLGSTPAASGQGQKNDAAKPTNYRKYWMWPVVAVVFVWAGVRWIFKFFDDHSASVSAVATVAIVVLTYFYVGYSKKQWIVMTGQLTAFEKVEGAYIGIGQLQGDIRTNQIGIPLENYGHIPSPRVWIYPHIVRFTKENAPVYTKNLEMGGDRTQIPPGAGRYGVTIPLELTEKDIAQLQDGTLTMWIAVTLRYDDGFGNISQPGFCYIYRPQHPTVWDACPTYTFSDLQKMSPKN